MGAIAVAFFVVFTVMGKHTYSQIHFVVLIALAVFFVKGFRNRQPGGNISFGKVFSVCFQAVLYAGIIYCVHLYSTTISPRHLTNIFCRKLLKKVSGSLPATACPKTR
jgi:energy-coupling factor transporter transmembrane protein EcfT